MEPTPQGHQHADGRVTAAMWTLAAVAVVWLLRSAGPLLIPIVLAILISYALEPVVSWLSARRVPRSIAAAMILASVVGGTLWTGNLLRDDAIEALEALPEVAQRARTLVWSDENSHAARQFQRAAEVLQGAADADGNSTAERRTTGSEPGGNDEGAAGLAGGPVAMAAGSMSSWLQQAVGSVLTLAGNVTVIVFLVYFLLSSAGHFRARIVEVAGDRFAKRRVTARIIDDINAQIQRFLLVRLVTATIVALATWAALAWMGVAQAAVWGVLAGVFNSIPYFGPVIVSGGLLVVGLVQAGEPIVALKMSGAALLITALEGWLLTPPLLGHAARMHVVVVFLGLLLWTWIWGAWGTILAVPMLVVVKSIADHIESFRPASRLMAP